MYEPHDTEDREQDALSDEHAEWIEEQILLFNLGAIDDGEEPVDPQG